MKPTPTGWPRISATLFYDDAMAAIDWICKAFDFDVRIKVEGDEGLVMHSELTYGEGLIMVADTRVKRDGRNAMPCASPQSIGGQLTQALCLYVDDADAHCEHARARGAEIIDEPETHDYGEDYWCDRGYRAADLEGHHWWFIQRLRG